MNLAILQARMSSSRLPGKVLKTIVGQPMLGLHIERLQRATQIDHLLVATSNNPEDQAIADFCHQIGIECYQGNLNNVLDRFYQAAHLHQAEHVIRLTADCPLASATVIDEVIIRHLNEGNDFTTNASPHTFPDGLDVEVISMAALTEAWRQADTAYQKEHVTPYISQNPTRFKIGHHTSPVNLNQQRWSVDYPEDFALVSFVYESLYDHNPEFTTDNVLELLQQHPRIFAINQQYVS